MASSGLRSVLVRSTKMPVELLIFLDLVWIDCEVIVTDCLEIAAVPGIADERFIPLGQLPLQGGQDRGAIGGILGGFGMIAAHDVTSPGDAHRLGFVLDFRAASSAMVSAAIIPRSATTQTRTMAKRRRKRSITGISVVTSAVLPGHISEHTGWPSPSINTARIICRKFGRCSLL